MGRRPGRLTRRRAPPEGREERDLASSRHGERGAAVAELALVLSLMLALLLVVFDFGRGFVAYVSVSNGARDGARVAMQDDVACTLADIQGTAESAASPYGVAVSVADVGERCFVTVSHTYVPILPFVTGSFSLPIVGTLGPLWDGSMSETMVSQ